MWRKRSVKSRLAVAGLALFVFALDEPAVVALFEWGSAFGVSGTFPARRLRPAEGGRWPRSDPRVTSLRRIDGSGNNPIDPEVGAAYTFLILLCRF